MFDNIQVAHQEGAIKNCSLVLEKDVNDFFIPKDLFRNGSTKISKKDLLEWIGCRIFPEHRVDCDKLLKQLDLNKYDPLEIAKKTKVCLVEDAWWLTFSEKDNFRNDTLRGKLGFEEWSNKL
ncbi:hypothetical protein EXW35_26535 [Bacillus mycoides]|nr:hypothetical protein EXW35_26535 [Bacillus mycoides]QWI40948.1 hypothetical protein EXW43_26780 [Bacillus mycoides]HDR7597788.1 hypothetical protein [Bacillus mycoides]